MIQECEFKDFLDIFYQGINRQRKEYGQEILSEDQQIPNQILDLILKGNQKEQEDKRALYKKCEMFCGEEDIIFCKQEMQMNQYSTNRSEVEEAIRYLFNQIYLDNQKEIQYNKKLTHMKIHLIKTHTDVLRSCFMLSAKPLQIIEFSYDTLIESYIIQGRLNRYISQEPINLYALKIMDQFNMKDIVIGPGRGQIDEKLNFKFKIPYQLLKDSGIQPSNNKCEIEFFHKIEADISHYNHFGFNFVDIDHTYSLIMRQSFHPVQNGRASAKKSRRDSPDVRRSNSLFKNRLSSSCNKENRIPNSNDKRMMSSAQYIQNSAGDNFFTQQVNQNQPYSYYSEKRSKGQQQQMDSIWEANEKDFSIYKDDNFRSEHRKQNFGSSQKQNQIFSFGEQDQSFFADSGNTSRQFGPNNNFTETKDFFFTDRQIVKQVVLPDKSSLNLFQNPQNNIFKQTPNPIIIKNSQSQNQQPSIFNGNTKPSNLFCNQADNAPSAGSIFATTTNSDKSIFHKSNKAKDIWNTNKKDLFQYEEKPENKSLQNPPLLSTNLFQLNNESNYAIDNINNNTSIKNTNNSINNFSQINQSLSNPNQQSQIFPNTQQINSSSEPLNVFQSTACNFNNNSTQCIIPQQPLTISNNNVSQNSIQNLTQNPIQNFVQNPIQNLVQNPIHQNNQNIPLLDNQNLEKISLQQQSNNIVSQTTLLNGSFSNNSVGINNNPFSHSERFYFKGVKHTFTQHENLAKLPQSQENKLPSNRLRVSDFFVQKLLLDSRNFKDATKKAQKLKEIEKIYKCCKEPFKSDYQKYWNTGEHCDFTLSLENDQDAFYKLHKVVVSHYSEYFRKLFNDQKFTHFTLKQNNFNNEAVRLMFKWMYFNELPAHEWEEMSFKQAQQTLNCALYTKTWEFLVQVIIKVIIPKMTSEKLIDFLILSEYLPNYFANRKEDESLSLLFGVLKLLQNYCILYFSNNSIEVIEKTEDLKIQQLVELNSDLIFTLVNETCLKFDTLDHLERLFIWLSKQAPVYFGRNIVELCSFFESQYLSIQQFDKIYMPFDKEIKSLKSHLAYTTPYFDKTPNLMKETPTKSAQKGQNDGMFDEDDIVFTEIENIMLSKKEWPSSNLIKQSLKDEYGKQRDAIFSRACDFTFQFKRPDIPTVFISEEFYSYSRKWRIILIVDGGEDQNISVFLRESGQRSQQDLDVNLYSERILFSSTLIRVEFQDRKSCSFDMFYSFANNQNMTIGRNKFCQAKRIADAQNHNIKINVWIEELKCHSGLMHYISQKLVQLIGNGFNEDQKKIAENEIEQSNKKRMINNEPVSNRRQSDRVMEAMLDKEWDKITAQMDEEGKILSPIKSRMSINRIAKDNFQQKTKELNIFSLPVFEAYYILTSDNLNINHEKYAIHLIYRVCLNKSDIEIDLLLHGVRFSYLDLDQMLNLARDHNAIKRNKYFQSMIRKELNQRFEMYQEKIVPLQKGRNHYDYAQFYKNQNRKDFKQNFLDWLFNQEHHPGFKSEIQKIQNAIKAQMEELRQKEFEINQQFMKLKQEQANMKVKQLYSNSIGQKIPFTTSASTNPSNNSQNGSIQSQASSSDDNLNRRNIIQPPSYAPTEPRVIYGQNGQPLLNLSNQERQRMKSVMDFNNNNMPYISSSKSIEKDNCIIF